MQRKVGFLSLSLLLVIASSQAFAASAASVNTLAGSGKSGYTDGPASSATFTLPMSIAVSPNGDIFVPDMGANRIRLIRDGNVSTIAGGGVGRPPGNGWWMTGGYIDGAAAQARFKQPSAVALSRDGTLYISDSGNHCIRTIRNGKVTTYAGVASNAGKVDGPRQSATFQFPRGLAMDDSGTLYIADYGNGLRKISPAGIVTTVDLPAGSKKDMLTSVAVWGNGPDEKIFVADHEGLIVIDAATGASKRYAGKAEGGVRMGDPDALVPLNAREVAFTDARNHALRLFWTNGAEAPSSNVIAGTVIDDATFNGGGFRDGSAADTLFFSPRGLAQRSNGDLIAADTGNRRIRTTQGVDLRIPLLTADLANAHGSANQVYFIGGSFSFFATLWAQSTPGVLEENLRGARVTAVRYAAGDSADAVSALRLAARLPSKLLIWEVTSEDTLAPEQVSAVASAVAASGRRLMVVALPIGAEASPYETLAPGAFDAPANKDAPRAKFDRLLKTLTTSGVPFLDLSPAILTYDASPNHLALFGTVDPHLTEAGNRFVAEAVAKEAEKWLR